MKRTTELFEDQEMEILAKRMFADGHAKLHRTIVHGAVDSDVHNCTDAVSMATRSNMLRQVIYEGKKILQEALNVKFEGKARLRQKRRR